MKAIYYILVILGLGMAILSACRNDNFVDGPNASLGLSADTLTFDTVFVQKGSVTGNVRLYNPFANPIKVSEINLVGNAGDQFRINVDGVPGSNFKDVIIPANDSLYIFVQCTIDPTQAQTPFVVGEDIELLVNGNRQIIHLMAWGQNARYYFGEKICDEIWDNNLPYVIKSRVDENGEFQAGVEVEPGCTLTIQAGTQVFFDGNSSGMIVRGTLEILGTPTDTVVFQGSRLENFFQGVPGQYLGIFIYRNSRGNRFEHFVMDEDRFGITIGVLDTQDLTQFNNASRPDLFMRNCIIKNNFSNALFAFNSNVTVHNSLMYGGTENLVSLGLGGAYAFENCTFFNSGDITSSHDKRMVLISNFAADNQVKVVNRLDSATFTNCIIHGTLEDEIDLSRDPTGPYRYRFDHCLLKTLLNTDTAGFINILKNVDPEFESAQDRNFQLSETSPCIDAGKNNGIFTDLDGKPRPSGNSIDIGAYEF